ncbi:hypothetical protein EJ04DRAFT_563599 [Polyplosphaeria fusca]|uniref:Uncharacterized protein n=1 Tax=Polyplosphaeria fusca TaxID=682080 RepID=A0A9P4QZD3_9PLEO|nr:hypothetical protein EJ04DRAFT_563599 [Polyplosphaeria fusca]
MSAKSNQSYSMDKSKDDIIARTREVYHATWLWSAFTNIPLLEFVTTCEFRDSSEPFDKLLELCDSHMAQTKNNEQEQGHWDRANGLFLSPPILFSEATDVSEPPRALWETGTGTCTSFAAGVKEMAAMGGNMVNYASKGKAKHRAAHLKFGDESVLVVDSAFKKADVLTLGEKKHQRWHNKAGRNDPSTCESITTAMATCATQLKQTFRSGVVLLRETSGTELAFSYEIMFSPYHRAFRVKGPDHYEYITFGGDATHIESAACYNYVLGMCTTNKPKVDNIILPSVGRLFKAALRRWGGARKSKAFSIGEKEANWAQKPVY